MKAPSPRKSFGRAALANAAALLPWIMTHLAVGGSPHTRGAAQLLSASLQQQSRAHQAGAAAVPERGSGDLGRCGGRVAGRAKASQGGDPKQWCHLSAASTCLMRQVCILWMFPFAALGELPTALRRNSFALVFHHPWLFAGARVGRVAPARTWQNHVPSA